MDWVCSTDVINEHSISVGKPEGKRLIGSPKRRWEDRIRMDVMEIGWEGVDWIHLAQDRDQWCALVNMVINIQVPLIMGNFLTR